MSEEYQERVEANATVATDKRTGETLTRAQVDAAWSEAIEASATTSEIAEADGVQARGRRRAELWGIRDCSQDANECVPFASTGGLGRREAMTVPDYVPPGFRDQYLAGYASEAERLYGADWRSEPFEWVKTLEVAAAEAPKVKTPLDLVSPRETVPARPLTTRELAKIIGGLIATLCEWNAVIDVQTAMRWLLDNDELWRVQAMSREMLEVNVAHILAGMKQGESSS